MNRHEKIEFLEDIKKGKANIQDLKFNIDYSRFTDDELRKCIFYFDTYNLTKIPNGQELPYEVDEFFTNLINKYCYANK